ncbi:hypothetical protein Y032_0133g1765 [Ancylostoma ceylanicum]|uniref:Uncharacterized protein n=1 Tax=Ancylostoma ceylanicum TaxID=53326 RepID=A0A016T6E6_9BILA|nr:hypothetical protein Y032_0133g1765 [Ancylostoma ceylanicum]
MYLFNLMTRSSVAVGRSIVLISAEGKFRLDACVSIMKYRASHIADAAQMHAFTILRLRLLFIRNVHATLTGISYGKCIGLPYQNKRISRPRRSKGYGMLHSDAVAASVHQQNFSCNCFYANTLSNANRVIKYENL